MSLLVAYLCLSLCPLSLRPLSLSLSLYFPLCRLYLYPSLTPPDHALFPFRNLPCPGPSHFLSLPDHEVKILLVYHAAELEVLLLLEFLPLLLSYLICRL